MDTDILSFSQKDLNKLDEIYQNHVKSCGNDCGLYKMPKHWPKFTVFSPPRSGKLYKGIICHCGFEWYEIQEGGTE